MPDPAVDDRLAIRNVPKGAGQANGLWWFGRS
jgi:hypothetical protein